MPAGVSATLCARRWALGSIVEVGALRFLDQLLVFLGLLMLGLLMLIRAAMMLLARWTYFFSVTTAGKRPICSIMGNIPGAVSMLSGSTCVDLCLHAFEVSARFRNSLILGKLHVLRNEQGEFDSVGSGQLPIPGRPTNPSHLVAAQRHIHVGGPQHYPFQGNAPRLT